jgi:hypothetical protein
MILRSRRNYYSQERLIDVHPRTDKCPCQGHFATSQGQIAQALFNVNKQLCLDFFGLLCSRIDRAGIQV